MAVLNKVEERNVGRVKDLMDWWNNRDVDSYVSSLAPDFIFSSVGLAHPLIGREPNRQLLNYTFATMPDWRVSDLSHVCARGNSVWMTHLNHGTIVNGFMGLPPMERAYSFHTAAVHEFAEDGEEISTWSFWNVAKLMMDLGVISSGYISPGDGATSLWMEGANSDLGREETLAELVMDMVRFPFEIWPRALNAIMQRPWRL